MPWFVSDRLLWTAVVLGSVLAYYYVPAHLAYVAHITLVPEAPDTGPNKQLRTDAEQAISHDTLRVLSDGYSHDIRAATKKIIANRTLASRTKHLILRDLASKDETTRWHAISALRLLFYDQTLSDKSYINQFIGYQPVKAIIIALRNLLESHTPSTGNDADKVTCPPSPVRPQNRPAHEELLLPILCDILTSSSFGSGAAPNSAQLLDFALRAGLVSKWLARYPFPCALPENYRFGFEKSDVCRLLSGRFGGNFHSPWWSDDPIMANIVQHILEFPQGEEALRAAGLLSVSEGEASTVQTRRHDMQITIEDVRMVNGESTAGALTPPEMRELLQSATDEDWRSLPVISNTEMENLRRRHRQAIVIAEAGRPLRRENILQRQHSDSSENGVIMHDPIRDQPEHELDLNEPIVISDQPWDLRRQEIEGEAIVNESIREAALNSRASRSSGIDRFPTSDASNETDQDH